MSELLADSVTATKTKTEIINDFNEFIVEQDHPCIMAQAVFNAENYTLNCYNEFGSATAAKEIYRDLKEFIASYNFENNNLESFMAVFPDSKSTSESEFEQKLWQQLNEIHNADNCEWDPEVSADPEDKDFSFSVAGKAFFVIGMHSKSSRLSRRSPYTTIVFNLHHQFENLRKRGVFEDARERIRNRDKKLQGKINPMVKDFGKGSEAKQYSGREVDESWKCPFHSQKKKD